MVRLIRMLHDASGEQFISPLLNALASPTTTGQEMNEIVTRVSLEYSAAAPTKPQA